MFFLLKLTFLNKKMARKCKLSVETRSAIFIFCQEKYSMRKIAKKFKISTSMVLNIIFGNNQGVSELPLLLKAEELLQLVKEIDY